MNGAQQKCTGVSVGGVEIGRSNRRAVFKLLCGRGAASVETDGYKDMI